NAGDVADADRCRHGGRNSLERANGTFLLDCAPGEETAEGIAPGKTQMGELEEAESESQIEPGTHQEQHEGRPPDQSVEPIVRLEQKSQQAIKHLFSGDSAIKYSCLG